MSFSQSTTRTSSSSSSSGTPCAYQMILDHILSYPGSYEIPLRTMYTLNCAPRARAPSGSSRQTSPTSSNASSPNLSQPSSPDVHTTASFQESLMAQLSQLPTQPNALPPSFITNFVLKCFPDELIMVDFPQALTGLDYVKDLEARRRREVAGAMDRLGIDADTLSATDANSLAVKFPGVAQWVKSIEDREAKIDALYTQLYITLRRWILINELSLQPFNKHNCMAMLNTLYPPMMSQQPTSRLTMNIIKQQREGFFKYIQSVERQGTACLNNLMQQGKGENDVNGWPAVTRTMAKYLQSATSIINECADIVDASNVSLSKPRSGKPSRHTRKADSGVSFNSDSGSSINQTAEVPLSPHEMVRPKTPSGTGRSGTALEKFARGLMTIGRNRTDATEICQDDSDAAVSIFEKPKVLRKMRSLPSIGRKGSKTDLRARVTETPAFDVKAMQLQREKYEATVSVHPITSAQEV